MIGIICFLIAIIVSPLRHAHRRAREVCCESQLRQIGYALQMGLSNDQCYPYVDDGGSPVRYTWIDVLVEQELLGNVNAAYCPEDSQPDALNADRARHHNLFYPGHVSEYGIDYSYGISVPLASCGWRWNGSFKLPGDHSPRRFENHDRNPAERVLAGDAYWSGLYNLSGDALWYHDWSYPTQFDNTVAWRHADFAANLLYQDSHVVRRKFLFDSVEPLNTSRSCLWYPGEPLNVGPEHQYEGNYYPHVPPIDRSHNFTRSLIWREMIPEYYTRNLLWTRIGHK
ncbi:MAG: hypothetical protein KAY37_10835 [Phycisphaerae bacterium]|nr:hypothetical protein [Phycisphaerae bacterium]